MLIFVNETKTQNWLLLHYLTKSTNFKLKIHTAMKKALLIAGFAAMALGVQAQNPFAYNVGVDGITDGIAAGQTITVSYNLNAAATGVDLVVYPLANPDVAAKTIELGAAEQGEYTSDINLDGLDADVLYGVKVVVRGTSVEAPVELTDKVYNSWAPYGVAIDNNTESPYFGRILFTETQSNLPESGYYSSETGSGVYEFNPLFDNVGFYTGGFTYPHFRYPEGAQSSVMNAKKVRISKDGRVFVGMLNCVNTPIYEMNPDNLNEWTPVFQGNWPDDHSGIMTDDDGNFVAGASAAFDVVGEGEDLMLVNLSCKYGQDFNYGSYQTFQYPLGEDASWVGGAVDEVMPLSQRYTISSQAVTLAYDPDGSGIWYAQYRGTPTDAQPAIKHVTKNATGWVEDYSDVTTVVRGGGIAFSPDGSLLAFSGGNYVLNFYEVDRTDPEPALNLKYTLNTTALRGFNDIAFDLANNVYSCDNGREKLVRMQLPYSGVVVTPARSEFAFALPNTTGVDGIEVADVVSVKYVNLNGQQSDTPFSGVNVVVKTLANGSQVVSKIVK